MVLRWGFGKVIRSSACNTWTRLWKETPGPHRHKWEKWDWPLPPCEDVARGRCLWTRDWDLIPSKAEILSALDRGLGLVLCRVGWGRHTWAARTWCHLQAAWPLSFCIRQCCRAERALDWDSPSVVSTQLLHLVAVWPWNHTILPHLPFPLWNPRVIKTAHLLFRPNIAVTVEMICKHGNSM